MTFHRLLAEHLTAAAALDALPGIAAGAGISDYAACPEGVARAELLAGRRAGARLIRIDSPDYPALLREIADAPPVLWVRGNATVLARPAVAVVGSRNASSLGLRMARGLARALAEVGVAVTAGLARGIDTAAHETSCETGTVAVMAGGIDVIYPRENAALADRICEAGCLVTEQAPGVEPVARHFPARNRIVSGLCAGVVVVEAAHRSGTLITARLAAEQGREVMAVPGHPIDARASGCNALIRDGATLVRNADDILAAISLGEGALRPEERSYVPGQGRLAGAGSSTSRLIGTGSGAVSAAVVAEGGGRGADEGQPERTSQRRDAPICAAAVTATSMAADARSVRASDCQGGQSDAHPSNSNEPSAAPLEMRLLNLLGPSPTEEDQLIRDLGTSPASIAPILLDLELDGRITRMPGGRIALVA